MAYTMIETDAYFEAYRHVLTVLKDIEEDTFPLKEYIVSLEKLVRPPKYSEKEDLVYCFTNAARRSLQEDYVQGEEALPKLQKGIVCSCGGKKIRIHDETEWLNIDFGLDDSQLAAVKSALTQSISIIQGPPGTGKTYVGLKVVELLLHNRKYWSPAGDSCPIVVVCYTNHALDQFLEGILKTTPNIVRIGGRSKSEVLSKYNLIELKKRVSDKLTHDYTRRTRREVECVVHELTKTITHIEKTLKRCSREVLLFEQLSEEMSEEQVQSLKTHCPLYFQSKRDNINELFGFWLGVEVQEGATIVPDVEPEQPVPQVEPEEETDEDLNDQPEIDMTEEYGDFVDEEEESINDREPEENIPLNQDGINNENTDAVEDMQQEELQNMVDVDYLLEQRMVGEDFQMPRNVLVLDADEGDETHADDANGEWRFQGGRKQLGKLINKRLKCNPMTKVEVDFSKNLWSLKSHDRWRLYKFWLEGYAEKRKQEIQDNSKEMESQLQLLHEVKQERERLVVDGARVVGLTTTGAAKYHHLIRGMKSKIVIVEEAAEVLEAHIVTSLSKNTQHVILIGDHQQLRPNPTVYDLAKKYNLEISLFERLITNGLPYCSLRNQHRMKPCISKLLVPNIYENLADHPSVSLYEDIKGMEKSMFFVKHKVKETQANDSTSRINTHEIDFLVELCRHLILQGYHPSRITILTTYLAQFFMLRRSMTGTLKEVKVTVVDNYQGEENDIILLSFVRSNEDGAIGFLKADNRVCVALSRAKHGLYCIGNFDLLAEKSPLWRKITQQLEEDGAIGTTMNTKCQNHGNLVPVGTARDFARISNGGCLESCDFRIPCGHVCERKCHPDDRDHARYKCKKKCERVLCDLEHQCPKRCFDICGNCIVPVDKVMPICQHKAIIPCHKDPLTHVCQVPCRKILNCEHECQKVCGVPCGSCPVMVEKLSPCGHRVKVQCHLSSDSEVVLVSCKKGCEKQIGCGHKCTKLCSEECTRICKIVVSHTLQCGHEQNIQCYRRTEEHWSISLGSQYDYHILKIFDTSVSSQVTKKMKMENFCRLPCRKPLECGHLCKGNCGDCVGGRIHALCREPCGNTLSCGHRCSYPCAVSCPPCMRPCENRCPHSRCQLPCGYPCVPCKERCAWKCKHRRCTRLCSEPCDRPPCNRPCPRKLSCGHWCIGMCGEPCPRKCRVCHSREVKTIFFGNEDHPQARFVELEDCGHIFEVRGFTRWIQEQQGNASEIKLISCPMCRRPLRKNLRYNAAVKQTVSLIERVKIKFFGTMETNKEIQQTLKKSLRSFSSDHLRITDRISAIVGSMDEENSTDPQKVLKALYAKLSDNRVVVCDNDTLTLFQNYVKFTEENKIIVKQAKSISMDVPNISKARLERILDFIGYTLEAINQKILDNLTRGSKQLLEDIVCEFERLKLAAKFVLGSKPALANTSNQDVQLLLSEALNLLFAYVPFRDEHRTRIKEIHVEMKKLCDGMAVLGISDEERLTIVRAMGLKQGHWYQCPNGHVYCITECGGAMVEGRCIECNATIGGGSHRLRSDNRVATAMDGARHAVWSDQANMGNYNFDNIL